MRSVVLAGLLSLIWSLSASAGQFVGKLEFKPKGCEATRNCRLVYDFGYIDSDGMGWQSSANDETDGATIPSWAQPVIGAPFEKDFIRAAVIHDHYCDRNVRTWRKTHWVFYDALIASGLSSLKAKVMYYGILIGGPKWVDLIPGEPCKIGQMCIKRVEVGTKIPGSRILTREGNVKIAFRDAMYDQPSFQTDFNEGKAAIEVSGDTMSLDQIDAMAKAKRPNDFFLNNGDAVPFQEPSSKFPIE